MQRRNDERRTRKLDWCKCNATHLTEHTGAAKDIRGLHASCGHHLHPALFCSDWHGGKQWDVGQQGLAAAAPRVACRIYLRRVPT